jgi:hypothetical protein
MKYGLKNAGSEADFKTVEKIAKKFIKNIKIQKLL